MNATAQRYRLAPAFDQVPMLYAPTGDGQLPERRFQPPAPTADVWDAWGEAVELAIEFWSRAAADARLDDDFRAVARGNGEAIRSRSGLIS